MPLNKSSRLVSEIITEVKRTFGDEADIQIDDRDIIRWINTASNEIVLHNRVNRDVGVTDITAGVAEYSLPIFKIVSIQSIYVDSIKLEFRTINEVEEYVAKWDPKGTATGQPTMWFQWGKVIQVYPVPAVDLIGGMVVYFVREPEPVQNAIDIIQVPDNYYESIVQYCLAKAYELDEDMDNSNFKMGQFNTRLGILAEQETMPYQATYPRITVLEDDSW